MLILAVMAIGVLAIGALPAHANVSSVGINFVHADGSGHASQVTGFIVCGEGEHFTLRVNVSNNDDAKVVGKASGLCTGDRQPWATKNVQSGGTFDCGDTLYGHGKVGTLEVQGSAFQFNDSAELAGCD